MTNSIKLIVGKDFLRVTTLIGLIYFILELYYYFFISPRYEYMGFISDVSVLRYLITKIIFTFSLIFSLIIYKKSSFLYSIYTLLIFFFLLPNAILYSFGNFSSAAFFSNVFFVWLFVFAPYIKLKIPVFSIPHRYKAILLIVLSVMLFLPIVFTFQLNLNFKTLLLSEIYSTREYFSQHLNGVLSYLYHFEVKTIIPVSIVFFMITRRLTYVAALVLMLMYLYVISGNKIVYFTTILVILFYYVGKTTVSKSVHFLLLALFLFILFPVLDSVFFEEPVLAGTFVNRFLFIPALLTNWYFDFFADNPFYFAESHFFNQFVKSPYDMPVGFMLTDIYWNEPTVFANNGIVSDGFMNLGYAGVVLFSVFFMLLFALFNSFKLHKAYFGIFFGYIYIFLSTPFLTCFITGGILFFILLYIFILNNKNEQTV